MSISLCNPHFIFKKHRNLFNTLKRIMKQNYYRDLFEKYKYDIRKTWGKYSDNNK